MNLFRLTAIRECRTLTPLGWGVLSIVLGMIPVSFVLFAYPFLAPTQPVAGEVLVVEGWLPDYALEKVKDRFENGNYKKSEKILLSTIHGAKGLEAANTILNCDWTYKPYETYCKGEKDRDDEIRVFYVGITRTKYNLFLYQPDFSLGEYRGMKHNNFWNKIRGK